MDPIHPITPGPLPVSRAARLPVERLERITRERDRPSHEGRQQPRREPRQPTPANERTLKGALPAEGQAGEDDDGTPHIDVRA